MRRLFVILGVLVIFIAAYVIVNEFIITEAEPPPPPPIAPVLDIPQADLAFEDVDITGMLSKGARKYEIKLSIINKGDLASNSFYISVSGLEEELEVTNIWPGDIIPVVFNIDLVGGEQIIYINLDPDNRVAENNEDNNNHQLSFPALHEFRPDFTPLSATQIKEYTRRALELTYEAETQEEWNKAKRWLNLALYAVKESNFEVEKYSALYEAMDEWSYGGSVPIDTTTKESRKESATRFSQDPDKNDVIERIYSRLMTDMGMSYGFQNK